MAAFEQSLSNMTTRLQNLSHTAEQKVKPFLSRHPFISALFIYSNIVYNISIEFLLKN